MRTAMAVLVAALAASAACAEEMTPFVIPMAPNEASLVALKSPPIPADGPRLVANEGHFMLGDRRVRIWGVNVCFEACFPAHADAEHIASRLAAGGVNSVRFHHMDTSVYPRGILDPKDTLKLHAEAVDRLDYFIDQLAKRGIWANVNLHVGRSASAALGLAKPNTQYDKIVGIFTPTLVEAQKQYARDLLGHVNPYRKVRLADDPAVAFVEITNEDSLFMWSAREDLRNLPEFYSQILHRKYNAWLKGRYGTTESLRAAWSKGAWKMAGVVLAPGGREGLLKHESLEAQNVALFGAGEVEVRAIDRGRFLADTEKAYFDDMYSYIKKDLGAKALVTGTIVFGPLGLYGQSDMDFVDSHAYWQHPRFPGRPWDPNNWTVEQAAMVDKPEGSTLPRIAAERMAEKPFTVTEYNHPAPNDYQAECVPMLAAYAAAQDWDGIWLFAYSHAKYDEGREAFGGFFDIDANPAKWGFMRAGAAIFREAAIPPHRRAYSLCIAAEEEPLASLAAHYVKHDRDMLAVVSDKMKTTWQDLLGVRLEVAITGHSGVTDNGSFLEPKMSWTVDEKGRGLFTASGPGAAVYVGHAGGKAESLPIEVTKPDFAAVTMTALDGRPLARSGAILVAACGRCENAGMQFSADRRTVGRNWGKAPVCIEPVEATVALPPGRWKCRALKPDGTPAADVPLAEDKGRAVLHLAPQHKTMWYLVTPAEKK
jgi:hypothetical protein